MGEDELRRLIHALERKNRAWVVLSMLVVAVVYTQYRLERSRQTDLEILDLLGSMSKVDRELNGKLDSFLGTHVEQMGAEHRKRYWNALRPYFPQENK